jgi:hypothetical protein
MLNRMNAYIVPLIAFLSAITGIVVIGETLLAVNRSLEHFGEAGKLGAPFAALLLIALIGITCALLARRASKLPSVEWPDPGPVVPVRPMNLGRGYIVGQLIFFGGLMIMLLFLLLISRR